MGVKLFSSAAGCAIYEDTAADLPFSDPMNHLDKIRFHSALDYIEHAFTVTGTIALPDRARGSVGVVRTNLFAHGLGAAPMVMGYFTINGTAVWPVGGMTPIQVVSSDPQFRRALFISCDATFVALGESFIARGPAGAEIDFPAVSVGYTLYVSKRTMPYATPNYSGPRLHLESAYVVFGGGRFDSRKRYFRATTSTGAVVPWKGRTMKLASNVSYNAPYWGYQCGGVTFNANVNAASGFAPAQPTYIVG